jgi:hypothetical protein
MEDIAIWVEVPSLLTRAPSAPKKRERQKESDEYFYKRK